MDREIIFLVEEDIDGGYVAHALGHSILTEADTWNELRSAVQDAVQCHFEPAERPTVVRLHMMHQEVLAACGSAQELRCNPQNPSYSS